MGVGFWLLTFFTWFLHGFLRTDDTKKGQHFGISDGLVGFSFSFSFLSHTLTHTHTHSHANIVTSHTIHSLVFLLPLPLLLDIPLFLLILLFPFCSVGLLFLFCPAKYIYHYCNSCVFFPIVLSPFVLLFQLLSLL